MFNTRNSPSAATISLPDTMAGLVEAAIIDARLLDRSTYSPHADH